MDISYYHKFALLTIVLHLSYRVEREKGKARRGEKTRGRNGGNGGGKNDGIRKAI